MPPSKRRQAAGKASRTMALKRNAEKASVALVAKAETHEPPDRRTLASVALAEAGEFTLLRDVAIGKQLMCTGVTRDGVAIMTAPTIKDRMAAVRLLVEYAEGKPRIQPSGSGDDGLDQLAGTSADAVEVILGQLERMARIAGVPRQEGIPDPHEAVATGESQPVEPQADEQHQRPRGDESPAG